MSGYSNLASYYGALFPPSDALKTFLTPFAERCAQQRLAWLDVGCGVGALLEWLLSRGVDTCGLEPDMDFVQEARRRLSLMCETDAADERERAVANDRVRQGAMADLGKFHPDRRWGAISCLGNVLAHAANPVAVGDFLQAAGDALDPGSALIVQLVNFDKVLAAPHWEFPVLLRTAPDGTPLVFERAYRLSEYRPGGRLRFDTVLRAGDRAIENSTQLFPARRRELESLASRVFQRVRFYGDFSGAPWNAASPATVMVCFGE